MKKEFGACKWLLVLYNGGTNHDSKTSQRRRGKKIHDVFFFSIFGGARWEVYLQHTSQNNKQQVGRSVGLDAAAVCILERVGCENPI